MTDFEEDRANWHNDDYDKYECYVCGRSISPSQYHDTGACESCMDDEDSGFDRG